MAELKYLMTHKESHNAKDRYKSQLGKVQDLIVADKHNILSALVMVCIMSELKNSYPELEKAYGILEEHGQQFPQIYFNHALLEISKGDWRSAVVCLDKYLARRKNSVPGMTNLAACLFLAEDYRRSVTVWKLLCLLRPDDLYVRYNFGLAMMKLADLEFESKSKTVQSVTRMIEVFRTCHTVNEAIYRGGMTAARLSEFKNLDLKEKVANEFEGLKKEAELQILIYRSRKHNFARYREESETRQKEEEMRRLAQLELIDIERENLERM
jgi:hypothetical protein